MPWVSSQITGRIFHDGKFVGTGYLGKGLDQKSGRNNPDMEGVEGTGPIPVGEYLMGSAYRGAKTGPVKMSLSPVRHSARGRTLLKIQGNNLKNNASEGCIIIPLALRTDIAQSPDRVLVVER